MSGSGSKFPTSTHPYQSWMGNLKQYPQFLETKINNIIFPGSHDSGTYGTGEGAVDSDARTQSLSVTEQLYHGIRYFDLRPQISVSKGYYYIAHGIWKSYNYLAFKGDGPTKQNQDCIFKDIRSFLESHPDEILILKFQSFESFGTDDYVDLKDLLLTYFRLPGSFDVVTLDHGTAAAINQQTVQSLLDAKKRVFVFFDEENVPQDKPDIWNYVFKFARGLAKSATYGLWDPYWDDDNRDIADDNIDLNIRWWPWHKKNLQTWNSDGFYVLQSHMQVLPGDTADIASGYFNLSEQTSKATYDLQTEGPNHTLICNNRRNIKEYLAWAAVGQALNIIQFDYVQYGDIVKQIYEHYQKSYSNHQP